MKPARHMPARHMTERHGRSLVRPVAPRPYIFEYLPAIDAQNVFYYGSANAEFDDWQCGAWSDDFNRSDGHPRDMPDHPWRDQEPEPPRDMLIVSQKAQVVVLGAGLIFEAPNDPVEPVNMSGKVSAANVTFDGSGRLSYLQWRIGLWSDTGSTLYYWATLQWEKMGSPPSGTLRLQIQTLTGSDDTGWQSATLASVQNQPLYLDITRGRSTARFLSHVASCI